MVLIIKAALTFLSPVFLAGLLKFSTVAIWLVRHEASVLSPSDSGHLKVPFPSMYIMNGLKF